MRWAAKSFLCAALVVSLAANARADDVEAAKRHFVQGTKDFDLGLYDDAIKEYMAAYDAKPDPALLYNIAQAHKLAGHPEQALRFYKIYLTRLPDAPNANEVMAKITELQKAIDQQQKARAMPPDQVRPLDSTPPATMKTPPEPTPIVAAPSAPIPDLDRGRTSRITGIAVAAVGVAALGAGIGMSVVAKQDSDSLSALATQHGVFDPSKDSTGRALGAAGPALIGIGAAAIVVGGVVFILGRRAAHQTSMALR